MGKVFVVGIGPGNFENMTIRADRALGGFLDKVLDDLVADVGL